MITIRPECECGHLQDMHIDGLCRQPNCSCRRYDAKVAFPTMDDGARPPDWPRDAK